jgi:TonB family protein
MKGNKLSLPIVIIATTLLGCQSTNSNPTLGKVVSEENSLIKYESRCDALNMSEKSFTREPPIVRVNPGLPSEAARKQIPGYAKMEFDITEKGKPININVIESFPNDLYHRVSIKALKKWRYKPSAAEQCAIVQLDFTFA